MKKTTLAVIGCAFATLCVVTTNAIAQTSDLTHYYIGVDNNAEVGFGPYTGLANPNQNRVTLLFNHLSLTTVENSHYHPIGNYGYTGDVTDPTVVNTNGNNRLPETYTGLSLELAPAAAGSPYEGMLISGMGAGNAYDDYGDLEIRKNTSIPGTEGYGPVGEAGTTNLGNAAYYMYTRDTQDFTVPLDGLSLELELVSATPGLAVGGADGSVWMDQVGDTYPLFDGAESLTPTFFVDDDAAPGVYSASFQLNDTSGTYLSSGTFHFDFSVVPEPGSASLTLLAFGGLMLLIRRK
ncbi:MAG: all3515 family Zur-repressed PEP-CTERM protein [Planctomycetota bacterium]